MAFTVGSATMATQDNSTPTTVIAENFTMKHTLVKILIEGLLCHIAHHDGLCVYNWTINFV